MSHRKREASLLLAGLLLLAGCTTGYPRKSGLETASPPHPAETESYSPSTAAKQPDLMGEWHRTGCRQECGATLVISEQTDEGFLVSADCRFYGNTGTWEAVPALFTRKWVAEAEDYWKDIGSFAHWDRHCAGLNGGPPVRFTYWPDKDQLIVQTAAGYDDLEFGAFVTISGYYTRGEPNYEPDLVDDYLALEEQEILKTLLGEQNYLWNVLRPINIGKVETESREFLSFLPEDKTSVRELTLHYPDKDAQVKIILTEDGRAYCTYNGRFFTNDPEADEMPKLWPWEDTDVAERFWLGAEGESRELILTAKKQEDGTQEVTIWDVADLSQPIQTITGITWVRGIVDVNFDGYMDIETAGPYYEASFWLWNEEKGCFDTHEALEELPDLELDKEHGVLINYDSQAIYIYHRNIYDWVNGEPLCVRKIEYKESNGFEAGWCYTLSVEDKKGNRFVRVSYEEFDADEREVWYAMIDRWQDLNYHGE